MNRLSTYTILMLAFFALGTFALFGASLADSIVLIGGKHGTGTSTLLLILSVIYLFCGCSLFAVQWSEANKPPKTSKEEDEKTPS